MGLGRVAGRGWDTALAASLFLIQPGKITTFTEQRYIECIRESGSGRSGVGGVG